MKKRILLFFIVLTCLLCLCVSGSSGNQLALYTTPNPSNFVAGNINLSLNGAPLEGQAYNLYHYTKPLDKKNVFCTWAFIWTVAMCIYALSNKYINTAIVQN